MRKEYVQGWIALIVIAAGATYFFVSTSKIPERIDPQAEKAMTVLAETYVGNKSFTIMRPATAMVLNGGFDQFVPVTKTSSVGIALLPELFKGTNLADAVVYVGATSTPSALIACTLESQTTQETRTGTTTISGADFASFHTKGVAKDDTYDVTTYRVIREDKCYEIAKVLHSKDVTKLPHNTVEFDQPKYSGYLENIAQSFAFLP